MDSEGYILIAIGERYKIMVNNFISTLRKMGDYRRVHIIDENNLNTSTKLFSSCQSSFERYGTYPKITLNEYLPFTHNIFLDADMLCGGNTEQVWDYFKSSNIFVHQLGLYDPNWNNGFVDYFENRYKKKLFKSHGSLIYINRDLVDINFFNFMQNEVWNNYVDYTGSNQLVYKNSRTDQVIYSIAESFWGIIPSSMMNHPFVTHIDRYEQVKHPQTEVNFRNFRKQFQVPISFYHMWEKSDTATYRDILKLILDYE